MDRRAVTNAGVLAVGGFSFLGFLPAIFKWIGWVEWAQGLSGVVTLFSDPRIHWYGVFLFLAWAAVAVAIVNNYRTFRTWLLIRHDRNKRAWDLAAVDFINQIAKSSNTARSFSDRKIGDAFEMFDATVKQGRIAVAGRRPDSGLLERIRPRELKNAKLRFSWRSTMSYSAPTELAEVWYEASDEKHTVLFRGLMVDYTEAHKVIP